MKKHSLLLTLILSLCSVFILTKKSTSHDVCPNKNPFNGSWYEACPHSHDPVEDIKRETDNLLNSGCAAPFVAYTRSVLATAGGEYSNKRAEEFLIVNGLFQRSEFNNIKIQFADLQGKAEGMVPAPNRILFDNSYRNADLSSIISLLAHEMIHIRQLKRMGNERFACQYSKFILNGQTNEIEKEAYDFQRKVDIDINNYYQSVMIRSDKDTSLYFNAVNGARHDGPLALRSDCTPFNLDCRWIFRDRMIVSAKDTGLALNAVNGARHLAQIRLRADCKSNNPDCTWGYGKKMFISDNNRNLPMNALDGARHDGHIYLHQDCVSSNPDCTWSIMQ